MVFKILLILLYFSINALYELWQVSLIWYIIDAYVYVFIYMFIFELMKISISLGNVSVLDLWKSKNNKWNITSSFFSEQYYCLVEICSKPTKACIAHRLKKPSTGHSSGSGINLWCGHCDIYLILQLLFLITVIMCECLHLHGCDLVQLKA